VSRSDLPAPSAVHPTDAQLEAGLDEIRHAPSDLGTVELIVARPALGERTVLEVARLDLAVGMVGDTWSERPSRESDDGRPHPAMQLTLMGSRVIALVAGHPERWPLAGDQLFVDLDLSEANLPAGTRLAVGTAIVELSAIPHTGCAKFTERFGLAALRFVNSPTGRPLRLRGANARIVEPGTVRRGDTVRKL